MLTNLPSIYTLLKCYKNLFVRSFTIIFYGLKLRWRKLALIKDVIFLTFKLLHCLHISWTEQSNLLTREV